MRERGRTRYLEFAVAVVVLLTVPLAGKANSDPYRTEALNPPTHYSPWTGPEQLEVPVPLLEVAPDTSSVLTLAQLTDLALRNNPRTRQAWAAARVEAAQYGVAKSLLMPRVDLVTSTTGRDRFGDIWCSDSGYGRYGPVASLSYVLAALALERRKSTRKAFACWPPI
jgi:outer membrane protein TolC